MKSIENLFKYVKQPFPEDCLYNISPSQIPLFFDLPKIWCEENLLGEDKKFKGNTGSVTGTIVHYLCESVTKGVTVTREDINKELLKYHENNPDLELDVPQIMSDYPLAAETIINGYVIPSNNSGARIEVEKQVQIKLRNGIYLSGTCDRIDGDCVVDYKIVERKPNEQEIPFGYKIQLLAYAYALRLMGYEINRIKVIYCVKPTKTLPARKFEVTLMIGYAEEKLIEDTLNLICDSIELVLQQPKLLYIVFKSMDLKDKEMIKCLQKF